MAVRPIRITGDPALHTPASPVSAIDDAVLELVRDMEETMAAAPGVGLAAPQVGVGLRIFIWSWIDDDGVRHRGTAINPQLLMAPLPLGDLDDDEESEGCLSIPGERFALRRSPEALLTATDLDGNGFEARATGWLARIFQHEFDHLDGVLYADRLIHPHDKGMAKAIRKKSWGSPGQSWLPGVDHLEG
ncbi:peptide deformylase [Pseudolysinimonas sp.]|uniref:peptide deformylase n=1 Tax=Pseudolysinimonas sp. TaxID=2680009 RepID=UPI00286AA959|nr:peptide deformylase [Pseudolysinimonas sp.]